jgi:alkaline phosphatase
MGLTGSMEQLTADIYADHHQVFEGFEMKIDSLDKYNYRLTVKNKRNVLVVDSYANYFTYNKKRIDLNSVVVYMPINNTFYLPQELRMYLELK